jgi:mRNA-degrading endonuclease toxin of MazEF toxin-antitoxin module
MTRFEFGDIVLVPFPFTDQTTTKKRPAVIISAEDYNRKSPDLIIMAITSQINKCSLDSASLHPGYACCRMPRDRLGSGVSR